MAIAMGIGLGATLFVIGVWCGQMTPAGGENGYFDTRGVNRLFWTVVLSSIGLIVGLPLGLWLGGKISVRPGLAAPVVAVLWLFPTGALVQWRLKEGEKQRQISALRATEEHGYEVEIARRKTAHDQYVASGQYAADVQKDLDRLEQFKVDMAALVYPGAVLLGTPHSRALKFSTEDDRAKVQEFLVHAGCVLGYEHGSPRGQRMMYYQWQGYTGTIYIEDAPGGSTGTWVTYNMPA